MYIYIKILIVNKIKVQDNNNNNKTKLVHLSNQMKKYLFFILKKNIIIIKILNWVKLGSSCQNLDPSPTQIEFKLRNFNQSLT